MFDLKARSFSSFILILAAAAISLLAGPALAQDMLNTIKKKGTLVVGVKTDYPPFGYLDNSGKPTGMEPDLAADVAKRLGVKLELVPVQTANRIEFLQQGRIDLMIATMSENPQRRAVVGVIEPYYFAGGTAVLAPKSAGLKVWEDLRGKNVCGIQGAYYNRDVTTKYGVNIVAFAGVPEALNALLAGQCIAFVQDSTLLQALPSRDPKFKDYESPLPVEGLAFWAIAVTKAERDEAFGKFISDTVIDWHKSGKLIEEEAHWGLPPSQFLKDMHAKYR
jgi:polar amino acid transport system substrate-binding protein